MGSISRYGPIVLGSDTDFPSLATSAGRDCPLLVGSGQVHWQVVPKDHGVLIGLSLHAHRFWRHLHWRVARGACESTGFGLAVGTMNHCVMTQSVWTSRR